MLIIFIASDYRLLSPYLDDSDKKVTLILAQAGIYELANILERYTVDTVFVIRRDLEASGLLTHFVNDKRISIIDYPEFVTLTTQASPCITVQ